MARVQNPIVGRMSGTLGNAIGSKWKGRNTLRAKPLEVANPRTDGQVKQRSRFNIVLALAKTFASVIRVGFAETAVSITQFNRFMQVNMLNDLLSWNGTEWVADYSKMVLAEGSLDSTPVASVSASNGSASVTVSFPSTVTGNKSAGDKACIVLGGDGYGGQKLLQTTRSAGSISVTMDGNASTGDEISGTLFFQSADGKKVSPGVYFTHIV